MAAKVATMAKSSPRLDRPGTLRPSSTPARVQNCQLPYIASEEPSQYQAPCSTLPCWRRRLSTTAKVSSVSQKARAQRQRGGSSRT